MHACMHTYHTYSWLTFFSFLFLNQVKNEMMVFCFWGFFHLATENASWVIVITEALKTKNKSNIDKA